MNMNMNYQTLLVEKPTGVAVLTLNQPDNVDRSIDLASHYHSAV